MTSSGIYTITNKIDGKIYVGKSRNLPKRGYRHKSQINLKKCPNPHLKNAVVKYGSENFEFEILEECEERFLESQENYWCNMLDTHNRRRGYNIKPTHPYSHNGKCSEETKEKLRRYKPSEEQKENLRKINTGKKYSEDSRKKRARYGKDNGFYGRKHSVETLKKLFTPVIQYDKGMKRMKEFISINEAKEKTGVRSSAISHCCRGDYKSAGGYIWRYKNI